MAKILCGISGIEFKTDYCSIYLSSREYAHPIFFIPQKKLLGLYSKYIKGELPEIDSYLLFLALLNSTDLVEWRVPASYTARTQSIIANNMDTLIKVVTHIDAIKNPAFHCARICISPETKSLDNVKYWLQSWVQSYNDFVSGSRQRKLLEEVYAIEGRLEALIKNVNRNEGKYAATVAEWAAKAGEFPTFPVVYENSTIPCSEYWKIIIRRCISEESIFKIPRADLQELIEHCEDNIEHGSIYSHALMSLLKAGLVKQNTYLGLGDVDINASTYRILDANVSVEDANKLAMIDAAPKSLPKESEYPSKIAYLRAKAKYDMALEYKSRQKDVEDTGEL